MISSKVPTMSSALTVMTRAVVKASRGLLRDFSELEHLQVSRKSHNEFVTNADLSSDKILREELMRARPDYSLTSEEGSDIQGTADFRWVIDPLDGTINFMHGFPNWAVSVALEKISSNEVIAGVTYDPVHNEMFLAEKGKGVYLNDRRLRVSGRTNFNELLCASKELDSPDIRLAKSVGMSIRKIGSNTLNLAYLAAARYDVFFNTDRSVDHIWDFAAGKLFIHEAGGIMADRSGKVTNDFLKADFITNINLLSAITKLLNN